MQKRAFGTNLTNVVKPVPVFATTTTSYCVITPYIGVNQHQQHHQNQQPKRVQLKNRPNILKRKRHTSQTSFNITPAEVSCSTTPVCEGMRGDYLFDQLQWSYCNRFSLVNQDYPP